MTSSDKKSSASIAIFLASNGANLYATNRKSQTPLDLCPDPNLLKLLTKCYNDYSTTRKAATNQNQSEDENNWTECMVCTDNKRDVLFHPCGHVVTCSMCALRVKKCLICKEQITTRTKVLSYNESYTCYGCLFFVVLVFCKGTVDTKLLWSTCVYPDP